MKQSSGDFQNHKSAGRTHNSSSVLPVQCPNCKAILPSTHSTSGGSQEKGFSRAAVPLGCLLCGAGSTIVILSCAIPMHPSPQWKYGQCQQPRPRAPLMKMPHWNRCPGCLWSPGLRVLCTWTISNTEFYSLQPPRSDLAPFPGCQLLCSWEWQHSC